MFDDLRISDGREYTDCQIVEVIRLKNLGISWEDIAKKFNRRFSTDKSAEALRGVYRRNANLFEASPEEFESMILRQSHNLKRRNSILTRQINKLLSAQDAVVALTQRIDMAVKQINKAKPVKMLSKSKSKRDMTIEVLLSDLHVGKLSKVDGKVTYNLDICKKRVDILLKAVVTKINLNKGAFNIERIIVAMLGDMIESSSMHSMESERGCEFGNARQIQEVISLLYLRFFMPIAKLGIPIVVPCVTGNHDRFETSRTYVNPGVNNVSWIVYKALEGLCREAGYTHIVFDITEGSYIIESIYGCNVLYEHFDNVKSNTKKTLQKLVRDRSEQVNKILHFARGGHFHEHTTYGRGTIIVNGSIAGQDSYAETLGFNSEATQTICTYVKTTNRPTPLFEIFVPHLG